MDKNKYWCIVMHGTSIQCKTFIYLSFLQQYMCIFNSRYKSTHRTVLFFWFYIISHRQVPVQSKTLIYICTLENVLYRT